MSRSTINNILLVNAVAVGGWGMAMFGVPETLHRVFFGHPIPTASAFIFMRTTGAALVGIGAAALMMGLKCNKKEKVAEMLSPVVKEKSDTSKKQFLLGISIGYLATICAELMNFQAYKGFHGWCGVASLGLLSLLNIYFSCLAAPRGICLSLIHI
eukprot:TRINITY_DN1465_c0_g1_i2.p1 TRINITY_DN1465_c0_g1~~TRINITY_DN1465_c0_g1_i2.p1  ORF type:complete len:156 (+),score=20.04 TRINITY_DN1465_c0_g1_i2:144-611(+)